MANEITIAASLLASKGGASVNTGSQLKALTMTGGDMYQATQNIDTTYEALVFGDITQPAGQMFIRNLDATNYIELALDTAFTNKICKIRPGCFAIFEPTAAILYAKANTAACDVMVAAVEA
jgi:hypothetical protein